MQRVGLLTLILLGLISYRVSARVELPKLVLTFAGPFVLDVTRVINGDSFQAVIQPFPDVLVVRTVRIRGSDAPEMRGACLAETIGSRECTSTSLDVD